MITPLVLGRQEAIIHHLPGIESIGCMTYDSVSGSIIMYDSGNRKLYQYHWESRELVILLNSGLGQIVSMSFDPYGNNLYYCDEDKKSVEVLSLTTREQITIHKSYRGDIPISVVAIPEHG